jgi:Flp pilus assembly protein TadG
MIKRLLHCTRATAAVEAAIFAPIFLILTLGVTDLGAGMFVRMGVNAASQSGAIYAVVNSGTGEVCESLTSAFSPSVASACLTAIKGVMNEATGDASFCTGTVCTANIGCPAGSDGSSRCITVTVSYPFTPILPDAVYSWATSTTLSSITTIRIL